MSSQDLMTKEYTPEKGSICGHIIENKKIASNIYQMIVECPEVVAKCKPGQFVSVLCGSVLLRRPFSIASVEGNNFQLIYKLVGEGTEYLSGIKPGKTIDLIGPLGNGFSITDKKALLIGAGVGIAPVIYLSKALKEKDIPFNMLAGFQSYIDIKDLNIPEALLITEDASGKQQGRVTEFLEEAIIKHKPQKIYACGPQVVLKYAVDLAVKENIDIEVALEEKFACGIGVCMGCIIEVYENNEKVNKRICKDGPVFEGRTVVW